jgi:hypothetical protein
LKDRKENPYTTQKIEQGYTYTITKDLDTAGWYYIKGNECELCLPESEVFNLFGELP